MKGETEDEKKDKRRETKEYYQYGLGLFTALFCVLKHEFYSE